MKFTETITDKCEKYKKVDKRVIEIFKEFKELFLEKIKQFDSEEKELIKDILANVSTKILFGLMECDNVFVCTINGLISAYELKENIKINRYVMIKENL